jgi:folate-binding protein YgfZ
MPLLTDTVAMLETALHDRLLALGARYASRDGWAVATSVGDDEAAHAAVRGSVGIADRGARSFTSIEGRDAERFLQSMVSNDVAALAVGSATYALLLTPKARIIADLRLLRLGEQSFLAETEPASGEELRRTLRRFRMAAQVQIEPAEERVGAIAIAGPGAGALIAAALGAELPVDAAEGTGAAVETGDGTLHALRAARYGVPAVELVGGRAALPALWDALAAALPAHAGAVFGDDVAEVLRVEAGVPRLGAELSDAVMPAEASVVERAVSFTKGCYPGQEPVARLHYRGHANRGLRAIALDGSPPEPGSAVSLGGREVGRVTSSVHSPALGRALALGILRREIAPGQRVDVSDADGDRAGDVLELPPVG